MQAFGDCQARERWRVRCVAAARAELAARAGLERLVVAGGVGEQFARAKGFEADGADAMLLRERQDFFHVALVDERSDGKHHHVAEAGGDGREQDVGVVRRDATKARFAVLYGGRQLFHTAAGHGDSSPIVHGTDAVEYKTIDRVEARIFQAGIDLWRDRLVVIVNLVDDEHAVTAALQRGTDDLFAVAVL